MKVSQQYPCIQINAPELKKNKAFVRWLNESLTAKRGSWRVATWHARLPNSVERPTETGSNTPIGDGSDIFLWKDAGDEGSDTDMPPKVWKSICKLAGENFEGIIWLTFF